MLPAVGNADGAALDLEHAPGNVPGLRAGQPHHQGEVLPGCMASKPDSGTRIFSAKTASVIGVRADGAMALTVTPYRASSTAATAVSAAIPALAAA